MKQFMTQLISFFKIKTNKMICIKTNGALKLKKFNCM